MDEIKKRMNRERVRKHREVLNQNDVKREAFLEKDRKRKAAKRKYSPPEALTKAQVDEKMGKDKERQQKRRRLLKEAEERCDRKKENGKKLRKKTLRDKNKLIDKLQRKVINLENKVISNDVKKADGASSLEELKEVLTPRSMRKIRSCLSERGKLKVRKMGLRIRTYGSTRKRIRTNAQRQLFPEVIDFSKDLPKNNDDQDYCITKSTQEAVVEFALKNSCDIPDVKKMKILKLSEGDKERVPVRFRYDTLDILHSKFLSEHPDIDIAYSTFAKNFPTETEAAVENSLRLIEECEIAFLHAFPYSPRPGTPARSQPADRGGCLRASGCRGLGPEPHGQGNLPGRGAGRGNARPGSDIAE